MSEVISIIIPVYNGGKFLEETLTNLRMVSYSNIEIVIIDDGSTDNSYSICKSLSDLDCRVKVFHQKNQGIIAARNKGLDMASGEYICFCDQDDIILNKTYELMLNSLKRNKADMCICGTGKFVEGEKIPYEEFEDAIFNHQDILDEFILPLLFDGYKTYVFSDKSCRRTGTIWKCMVRKTLITQNEIRFKRFINFEDDQLFFFDCLSNCTRVSTIKYIGYYWRINSESETYRWRFIEDFCEKEENYYLYLDNILKRFSEKNIASEEFKKYFYCTFFSDLIDNEGSPQNLRTYKERISYLKKAIYQNENYNYIIKGNKNVEWGFLRKKIILILLRMHLLRSAYCFNVFYRKVKKIGIRFKIWSHIEKKIRGK